VGCGGEIENLKTQDTLDPNQYIEVIEPLLAPLGCEACHAQELGGFKFTYPQDLSISNENFLYIQQSINSRQPLESPLLTRLTAPEPSHPIYFCETDCRFQSILAWISTVGQVDYEGLDCEAPLNDMGPITDVSICPSN
jgi:hypothetical protein